MKNKKPKKSVSWAWFVSFQLGGQVGMVPELAARQAQGIIMRRAPVVKLGCTVKFGTSFASSIRVGGLYSI
jgi:hypothetical protein